MIFLFLQPPWMPPDTCRKRQVYLMCVWNYYWHLNCFDYSFVWYKEMLSFVWNFLFIYFCSFLVVLNLPSSMIIIHMFVLRLHRYVTVVEELVKYPSSFSLSPSLIKLTQAFWLLDHKDFQVHIKLHCFDILHHFWSGGGVVSISTSIQLYLIVCSIVKS